MKRIMLIASIAMIVVGIMGQIYANNYTYVDTNGVLRDSAWMPISAILLFIGFLFLLISAVLYIVYYFKNRK
ncbi:MAG: DUF3955 domain-containing protein [Anaerolineaceae bacterium]|nr:DUF3955 domain-containing protein [Anaerolineaceae bacterium]